MLLFVGDKSAGYWTEEPAKVNQQNVEYVESNLNIKNQTNEILRMRQEEVKYVVYDLEQYSVNATEIADEILNIYRAGNAEPIFLATSFLPSSELVVKLQQRGFNKFIFAFSDVEKKTELEKCMNGYYNATSPEQLLDIPVEEQDTTKRNRVTISVGGAYPRMGTTTLAVQLVKYLLYCGKKACYIEMNSSGFVQMLQEVYELEELVQDKGKVRYGSVDMYYRQDLIPEILHMDYEYFVYDYGAFKSPDFNKISFLEKDIKLMTVGSNPGELQSATELIGNIFYQDIKYVFNFTSSADQADLLEMMGDKAGDTFFLDYCPDMFHYVPADFYTKIFPSVVPEEVSETPKKSWWRFGKNGKI